jgi:hypothetical protein
MNTIQPYLNDTWAFLHEGFNNVNAVKGLIIALIAAVMMPGWNKLWAVALGATIMDELISVLMPVISQHAPFRLPQLLGLPFWRHVLVLYVGYVIVITALFFVRANVLNSGGKAAKHS